MRGKDDRPCAYDHTDRITPAYAGKRVDLANTGKCPRDHPRVCGEKFRGARFRDRRMGSPPRMRGKVLKTPNGEATERITPAYAGKSKSL